MTGEPLLQLRLPAIPLAVPTGRRAVKALALLLGVDVTERFELCVSELLGNSVRHAALDGGDTITVSVYAGESGIRLEVRDSGRGFVPPREAREAGGDTPPAAGGYGLPLVESLSDRWGVEVDDETRVWCEATAG